MAEIARTTYNGCVSFHHFKKVVSMGGVAQLGTVVGESRIRDTLTVAILHKAFMLGAGWKIGRGFCDSPGHAILY